jgi:hypothetical protein
MNRVNKIIATVLLVSSISPVSTGSLLAEDLSVGRAFKPLQGVLFDAGAKHAVGYFSSEAKSCKLVLTIADEPTADAAQTFTVVRHEAQVQAGRPARYNLSDGKIFEFTCAADAQTMTMKQIERIATGAEK